MTAICKFAWLKAEHTNERMSSIIPSKGNSPSKSAPAGFFFTHLTRQLKARKKKGSPSCFPSHPSLCLVSSHPSLLSSMTRPFSASPPPPPQHYIFFLSEFLPASGSIAQTKQINLDRTRRWMTAVLNGIGSVSLASVWAVSPFSSPRPIVDTYVGIFLFMFLKKHVLFFLPPVRKISLSHPRGVLK